MWREINPICLYLRGIVRAEFGKEFAIYAENPQVTAEEKYPRPAVGKLQHQSALSGSGVSCYINILEALQKG